MTPVDTNPYEIGLDRNAANYVPLTPMGFLLRSASVYPDRLAVAYGERRYSWRAALDRCRRARAAGLPVYVETRPLYLHLTRERFDEPDAAKYVGAPPLREQFDREALWAGLAGGDVDTVCSDHAPWTLQAKLDPALNVLTARQGVADLETLMPCCTPRAWSPAASPSTSSWP